MKRVIGVMIGDGARRIGTLRYDGQGSRDAITSTDRRILRPDGSVVHASPILPPQAIEPQ